MVDTSYFFGIFCCIIKSYIVQSSQQLPFFITLSRQFDFMNIFDKNVDLNIYIIIIPKISTLEMIYKLEDKKNMLHHIHEQYESSSDSLLFVHGLMCSFVHDLQSTSHTRKAQINTMTTQGGVKLRNIILLMHDNLANEIRAKINDYFKFANLVRSKTNQIFEAIKQAQLLIQNYNQCQQFYYTKANRISYEIDRLQKINQQFEKKQYLNGLKTQFKMTQTAENIENIEHLSSLKNIKQKLNNYAKQQTDLIKISQKTLKKMDQEVIFTYQKLQQIQKCLTEFLSNQKTLSFQRDQDVQVRQQNTINYSRSKSQMRASQHKKQNYDSYLKNLGSNHKRINSNYSLQQSQEMLMY